jgi:hypothetical protein
MALYFDDEKNIGEDLTITKSKSFPSSTASKGEIDRWHQMTDEEKYAFEKKLLRKLDSRLLPWPTLLYLLSFLDRTNIGNAKIQNV